MATKEMTRAGKPENLQNQALTMALAILVERIRSLPKDDKEDLYELMKEVPAADADELQEIGIGILEILDQEPVTLSKVDCDERDGLENWMTYVGTKIRQLREARGMTQVELASKSGLPQSHISRLEGLKHSPSRVTLEKIAKALDVKLSELDPTE